MKKLLSVLITLLIFFLSTTRMSAEDDNTYLDNDKNNPILNEENIKDTLNETDELPEYFSLVDEGRTTPVRDQAPYGTCWAHGTIGSVESSAISKGYADSSLDLSELHIAYFDHNNIGIADPLNLITNDGTVQLSSFSLNNGGVVEIAMYHAANGIGFVDEAILPYSKASDIEKGTYIPDSSLCYESNAYRLTNSRRLNMSDSDTIKRILMEQGAITIEYSAIMYYDGKSFNPKNGARYYVSGYTEPHAATLVGWDDNYSVDNFLTAPPGNGAWLVKESAGTLFGKDGYLWISYYDSKIYDKAWQFEVEPDNHDTRIYQYDGSAEYSYFNTVTTGSFTMGNIYKAQREEQLSKVGFFTDNPNLQYQIDIYTDLTNSSKPDSGTLVDTIEGLAEFVGYHTVETNKFIKLSPDQSFSVVVKLIEPNGKEFRVFYDKTNNYEFTNATEKGQSFKKEKSSWIDGHSSTITYRIKALTDSLDMVTFESSNITLDKGNKTTNPYKITYDKYSLRFSSSNAKIVEVDSMTGVLTANDYGTVTITAQVQETGRIFTYEVNVPHYIDSISLESYPKELRIGSSYTLSVSYKPIDAVGSKEFTFKSSNPDVATIDETGLISTLKDGETTITITSFNNKTTSFILTVLQDPTELDTPSLTISRKSKNEVSLSWDPVTNADYYEIEITNDASFKDATTLEVETTSTSHTIDLASEEYYFRIRACYKSIDLLTSKWSIIKKYNFFPTVETTLTTDNKTKITLDIKGYDFYDGYDVYRSDSIDGPYALFTSYTTVGPHDIIKPAPGKYWYKVKAYTKVNDKTYYSDLSQVEAIEYALPKPVINSITWSDIKKIDLSWDIDIDADYYTIYRSLDNKYFTELASTVDKAYRDQNAEYGNTYYYKVKAYFLIDKGSYSTESNETATITTKLINSEITSLNIASTSGIEIKWNKQDNPQGTLYQLYRSTSKSGTYKLIAETQNTTYIDNDVKYKSTYYYKLKVTNNTSGKTYSTSYSNIKSLKYYLDTPDITEICMPSFGSVYLEWKEVEGVDYYEIQYSSNSKKYSVLANVTANSYYHTNLLNNTTVSYKITAIKKINGTVYKSNTSSTKSISIKLATPTINNSERIKANEYKITWNVIEFADSYDVYYSTSSTKNFILAMKDVQGTECIINKLDLNKTYYVKVVAKANIKGNIYSSSDSKTISISTIITKPTKPSVIVTGINSMSIEWNPLVYADKYELQYSKDKSKNFTTIYTGTDTSYEIDNLDYNTTYYFKVAAIVSSCGIEYKTSYSDVNSNKIAMKTPDVPIAQRINANSFKLNWNKVEYADSYDIYYSTNSSKNFVLASKDVSETTCTISNLELNKTYYIKVLAKAHHQNKTLQTSFSKTIKISTTITKPTKPSIIVIGINSMSIEWNPLVYADKYELQYSKDKSKNFTTIYTGTDTSFVIDNLDYNTTYYFKVAAIVSVCDIEYKTSYSDTANNKSVLTASEITGYDHVGLTDYIIHFKDISTADNYDISYSLNNKTFTTLISGTSDTAYHISNLEYGKTYYFKVTSNLRYRDKDYHQDSKTYKIKVLLDTPVLTCDSNNKTVNFNITNTIGATDYEIYQSKSKSGTYKKILDTKETTCSYTNTDTKTYYYKIKSYVVISGKTYYSSYSSIIKK